MSDVSKKSCLDNIMQSIIEFLQYDIRKLFGCTSNEICNTTLSESTVKQKDIIEYSYGCRPKIYNGCEEKIEISEMDLCLPEAETENECCTKKEKQKQNCSKQMEENTCELDFEIDDEEECSSSENDDDDFECTKKSMAGICRQIYQKIHHKCSSASVNELTAIEKKAQKLWDCTNKDVCSSPNAPDQTWCQLKANQKLPYYWAALSGDSLTENPFENFKRFYLSNIPKEKRCTKKTNEKLLIVWHSLATEQKLPFIMEAFISKIGCGEVNICDEHQIQRLMKRLQRNCS